MSINLIKLLLINELAKIDIIAITRQIELSCTIKAKMSYNFNKL